MKDISKHILEHTSDLKSFLAVCDTDKGIIETLVYDLKTKCVKLDMLTSKRGKMITKINADFSNFIKDAEDNMKRVECGTNTGV